MLLNNALKSLINEANKVDEQIKALNDRKDAIKKEILGIVDDKVVTDANDRVILTITHVEGSWTIDSAKLKAERPEIFEAYKKQNNGYDKINYKVKTTLE